MQAKKHNDPTNVMNEELDACLLPVIGCAKTLKLKYVAADVITKKVMTL